MPWCPTCRTTIRDDHTDTFEVGIGGGRRMTEHLEGLPPSMREPMPCWFTTWWLCFGCMDVPDAPWRVFRGDGKPEPISTFTHMQECLFCKGPFLDDRSDAIEVVLRGPCTKDYEYPGNPPKGLVGNVKVPAWQAFSSICTRCLSRMPEKWKDLFRPMEMGKDFVDLGPLPYKM